MGASSGPGGGITVPAPQGGNGNVGGTKSNLLVRIWWRRGAGAADSSNYQGRKWWRWSSDTRLELLSEKMDAAGGIGKTQNEQ